MKTQNKCSMHNELVMGIFGEMMDIVTGSKKKEHPVGGKPVFVPLVADVELYWNEFSSSAEAEQYAYDMAYSRQDELLDKLEREQHRLREVLGNSNMLVDGGSHSLGDFVERTLSEMSSLTSLLSNNYA